MTKFTTLILLGFIFILTGCINNGDTNEFEEVNSWIKESMEENYLWNERVPDNVDGSLFPGTYFGGILDPNDFFSYIVDDADLINPANIDVLFNTGASPSFGRFSNSNRVFSILEFVYPNSPADTAGLERGDIIIAINGIELNTFNFLSLFYSSSPSIRYSIGEYNPTQNIITDTGEVIILSQEQVQRNPVVYTDVIEQGGAKIGYLFYAEFLDGENNQYQDSVDVAIQDMRAQGVTDLIIDLRHNPGGDFGAAENLANAIVASSAAQNEEVFVRFQYNDIIQQRIIDEEGSDSDKLIRRFAQTPDNLGLNEIYFLTTRGTSFTSELLINGLIPHMDVNIIGEATSGDFFGSTVIRGEDATPANEYAIVPVNLQYENSEGTTNLVFGLQPDVEVQNDLLISSPIGDLNDRALNAAVNLITGVSPSKSNKSALKEYETLDNSMSKRKGSILFDTKSRN